jgi:hypothetical protein
MAMQSSFLLIIEVSAPEGSEPDGGTNDKLI